MSDIEAVPNCRFYVQIDGINQAVFTDLTGLQIETTVQEYEEGGNNGFVHRLPGRTKVSNVTLKRGLTTSNEFFKWCLQIAQGKIVRRNISVLIYDSKGEQVCRWDFINAYPVKWVGPQFTAGSNAMAIETLELAHDGLKLS